MNNGTKEHVDSEWINKKIDGHGGSFSYNSYEGLVVIRYIGHKSRIQIFVYNVILFFKYLLRNYQFGERRN